MKVAVIGGGAAGFFAAIQVKENYPSYKVSLFEKSAKVLSKVKISGGGRCNVTHHCESIKELVSAYPRGSKFLKSAFRSWDNKDMWAWLHERKVPLHVESDNRVFPKSNDSQSIIDCFLREIKKAKIDLHLKTGLESIEQVEDKILLRLKGQDHAVTFDKVILATGGNPKKTGYEYLEKLGHDIMAPLPSLFTFNMPQESIVALMGVVAPNALVRIQGSKLKAAGPLLITHWGMSGPAILKLSAFGAAHLAESKYNFKIQVNWANVLNQELVLERLQEIKGAHSKKQLANQRPFELPARLWHFLIKKIELAPEKVWGELGSKSLHKLANLICNDVYTVSGKTTFKEEFVTCGGVSLKSVDKNLQSKVIKNLYFAGELLDIDGITGGFNFQAAWTTAFIAAKLQD